MAGTNAVPQRFKHAACRVKIALMMDETSDSRATKEYQEFRKITKTIQILIRLEHINRQYFNEYILYTYEIILPL